MPPEQRLVISLRVPRPFWWGLAGAALLSLAAAGCALSCANGRWSTPEGCGEGLFVRACRTRTPRPAEELREETACWPAFAPPGVTPPPLHRPAERAWGFRSVARRRRTATGRSSWPEIRRAWTVRGLMRAAEARGSSTSEGTCWRRRNRR